MSFERQYYECECHSEEHTISFVYDEEDNEIYLATFLNQYRNFFGKLLVAFKYIFGYKCKYGHWDTTIIQYKDVPKLIALLNRVLENGELQVGKDGN